MPLNIEIKARCSNHDEVRTVLRALGADFKGLDHQIDTYFRVPSGRLKLREGTIENALIYYEREDQAGPKRADVILHPVNPNSSIKQLLTSALGILVTVDKRREIYFVGNVKVHLDMVKDLGAFVEIEAQDDDGTKPREELFEQCRRFMELLSVAPTDLMSNSYSDLLLERSQAADISPTG